MLTLKSKNKKLAITDRQEQILIGSVLGDAYITKRGQIQFEQGIKQKDYLFWKHKELSTISYKNISIAKRFDKRYMHQNVSYRFWTKQYFLSWRGKFYSKRKKIVPKDIKLTPFSLAVWYMDDGCLSDHKCIISTDSYSKRDIMFLKKILFDKFGIKCSIKNKSKLMIKKESFSTFFSIINPFIFSSLKYKIFDPVTTSL